MNRREIKEYICDLGNKVILATSVEMKKHEVATTTDHWTSENNETYTTTTGHWIHDWSMKCGILDFKKWIGRSTGELIFQDFNNVLDRNNLRGNQHIICISDTAANMGSLGKNLREEGHEHGYCFDHNLHNNALLAFEDDNLPGADGALRLARSVVEYFTKSSQAMTKLIEFQKSADLLKYQQKPLKVLQDVKRRWWSTYRMIKRLRHLKEAIGGLLAKDELVTCSFPTEAQWGILEEIENALCISEEVQRQLEGEQYVTSSLVPLALHQIRKSYVSILNAEATSEPVKELMKKMLDDLDKRYVPITEGEMKKIKFDKYVARGGRGNRYLHLHKYLFYASFVDPRTKNTLKKIMNTPLSSGTR